MQVFRYLAAACCLLSATVGVASDYGPLADAAKAAFRPLGEQDLGLARARLSTEAIAVERTLNPATEFGARWLEFLAWDGVQKQLGPSAESDLAAARETLRRLGSGAPGLERPEFQRAADALADYLVVASFAPAPAERQMKSFEATVDGLAERLGDPAELLRARASHEAERRLALLAGLESLSVGGASQGGDFWRRAYAEFGRPNAFVEVQSPLLNRLVARPVSDCGPLADCILGTSIRGTGATSGRLTVSTLPSLGRARLAFHLAGTTRSDTSGVNGPVQISSVGTTNFSATKVVEIDNEAFGVGPATASAVTRSQTRGVSKIGGGLGRRLVERIARQRVAEQKPRADAIASDHAEDRVAERLDKQLAEQIVDARRRYDERITRPLRQRRATPRSLVYHTDSSSLSIEAVMADDGQLAAWAPPPPGIGAPLAARLHQSAVNNLLDAYLGGATLRRESIDQPTEINVVAPAWLKLEADPPAEGEKFQPWSVKLRDERPVSVEFRDGAVTTLVHAERIQVEDKTYDGWDLVATYRPELVEGSWRLVRQGDVDVLPTAFDPTRDKRLTKTQVGLRANLVDALNKGDRVPASVKIDPIDLSDRDSAVRFLSMTGIQAIDGWLVAGWQAL